MKNNPRPTLRGTSTCFRVSPGVERVRERSTLPPLIILHRHLFALAWANARATGMQGREAVTFRKAKAFDCVHPPAPSRGRRKAEEICIHPHSPPQGGREKGRFSARVC